MENVYLVRRKSTGQYLNQKGQWAKGIASYRLKEFATEEEAKLAFPEGEECLISKKSKKSSAAPQKTDDNLKFKYYLEDLFSKCYLNSNNEFKVWAAIMPEAVSFSSLDDALDKAEELNLDLDKVRVVRLISQEKSKT